MPSKRLGAGLNGFIQAQDLGREVDRTMPDFEQLINGRGEFLMVSVAHSLDLCLSIVRELCQGLKELVPSTVLAGISNSLDEFVEKVIVRRREYDLMA